MDLLILRKKVRTRTGGHFEIHPFYGAVYGTKLTTVAPDFLTDLESPDDKLSMIIYLTNNGENFDPRLTREYQRIGTSYRVPSRQNDRHLRYMDAAIGGNPNQENRDQAIANGLQEAWENEFEKFNSGRIPQAMHVSPSNVVDLMRSMTSEGVENAKISRLNLVYFLSSVRDLYRYDYPA